MNKLEKVRQDVKKLYKSSSDECMRTWFFENHVEVVEKYAEEIAAKSGANKEIAVLAALFHDVARVRNIDKEPELMDESLNMSRDMMKQHGYSEQEIEQVKSAILPHSCRGTAPETPEAKVLATADALAHLMTDFYFVLPFNGWLKAAKNFEGYRNWVLEKIERDFNRKIFFDEYKELVRKRYDAIKTIFNSRSDISQFNNEDYGERYKSYVYEQVRQEHPRAYASWTQEEDNKLRQKYSEIKSIVTLSKIFQRKPGAIRSRLKKLGLIQDST